MAATDTLLTWLNNAYGLEESAVKMLEGHAKDYDSFPEIKAQVAKHIEETKQHAELVKGCIEALGGNVSEIKGTLGALSGMLQGAATAMYDDELAKNIIADYTAENLEIATYTALIAAAEELDDTGTADVAKRILTQEEEAADFLRKQIPTVIQHVLATA